MPNGAWGRGLGGAATGFGAGMMMGGPVGAGIGALGGGLAGLFGQGQRAEPGGWQWLAQPQYSFTEPRYRLTSDVIMQELERMQAGELPAWYSGIAPLLREQQKRGLQEQYFGGGFGPGILEQQEARGVRTGLGRGAAQGEMYGKQLQKYAEQSADIDRFIAQLGFQAQQQAMTQFPTMGMQIPAGPAGAWQPYQPSQYQPGFGEQALQTMGTMAPYMQRGQGIDWSNLFGGRGAVTPMGGMYGGMGMGEFMGGMGGGGFGQTPQY